MRPRAGMTPSLGSFSAHFFLSRAARGRWTNKAPKAILIVHEHRGGSQRPAIAPLTHGTSAALKAPPHSPPCTPSVRLMADMPFNSRCAHRRQFGGSFALVLASVGRCSKCICCRSVRTNVGRRRRPEASLCGARRPAIWCKKAMPWLHRQCLHHLKVHCGNVQLSLGTGPRFCLTAPWIFICSVIPASGRGGAWSGQQSVESVSSKKHMAI